MYNSLDYFNIYNTERYLSKEKLSFKFWDIVVLTAADVYQKEIFEKQISQKIDSNLVPKNVFYHVFSDPPNYKIGCGGATMHTICELFKIYENDLLKMKILVLNAGGYSQRLPSSSILGKVFSPFPFGSPAWHFFDAKLAMYIPFIQRMNPGYFITSSDTIELYNLDSTCDYDSWNFFKPGFTAIAHPSSLDIGVTHGVYVLDNSSDNKLFKKCIKVLQKPSIDEIRLNRAIVVNENIFDSEFVYTDSCFYFDHNVGMKLLDFYDLHKPLEFEIDAYGDFLKCPGSHSFEESFQSKSINCEALNCIRNLFKVLHQENLNVITLNESEFIHFGTMREYIINFSKQLTLFKFLNWKNSLSSFTKSTILNNGTLIYSYLLSNSDIGNNSILEYCKFTNAISVGENCILNHCYSDEIDHIVIPDNVLIHTISLSNDLLAEISTDLSSLYVTIIYGIDDDIKKKVDISTTIFNNVLVTDIINKIPRKYSNFDKSLWELKIFPVEASMSRSLTSSLHLLTKDNTNCQFNEESIFISMEEAVKYKNSFDMLEYRNKLINLIDSEAQ